MSNRFVNENLERALIGAVIIHPPLLDEINLPPEAFSSSPLKKIWASVLELYQESGSIDPVLLGNKLSSESANETLAEIISSEFSSVNAKQYAEELAEKWLARRLHGALIKSVDAVRMGNEEAPVVAANAVELIEQSVSALPDNSQLTNATSGTDKALEFIESGQAVGISTGFAPIDDLFTLTKGSFIVLAARPGMGKSALADQIAEHVALAGYPALVASLEMSDEELTMRRLSRRSGIPIMRIAHNRYSQDERSALEKAVGEVRAMSLLYTYDNPSATIAQIASAARKIKREHGSIGLIVIDYLQQMVEGDGDGNKVSAMTSIARNAKVLARELDTTVMGLSQLSRAVEYRQNKEPVLSDLRESGGIEQAANTVAFIYRPDYYLEEPGSEYGKAKIIVRKNRNAPLGTAIIRFEHRTARFH